MIKKEMKYRGFDKKREIIGEGVYKGFNYYIINLGTHPCSYVEIPKNHKLYKIHYNNIDDIDAHGGLTFSADHLIGVSKNENRWFIGWDYAHYGDYCCFADNMEMEGKKYTIDELIQDVEEVIDQLAD